jgi:hypothetical protein
MSHYYHRSAKVEVGQDHVTITNASGAVTYGRIVHAERRGGLLVYAMLDRCIHDTYTNYSGYEMSGCFATEVRIAATAMPDLFDDEVTPALFDVSPELAKRIADKVRGDAPDCWVGIQARENVIRGFIHQLTDDEAMTERLFEQLKASAIRRNAALDDR